MDTFKELNGYPNSVTGTNVLLRLIEGIGFRYYWGTEGLTESDLSFVPGNDGRTIYETLDHIAYMATFVANILEGQPTSFPEPANGLSFSALRKETLGKLVQIRTLLASSTDQDFGSKKVLGTVDGHPFEVAIWHLINGPILDVGHHVGQLTMMRRSSGNPIDPKADPFIGKRME